MLELNKVYNIDCIDGMKLLDNESIDLTVTSPPYFNLKDYEDGFVKWKTYNDYVEDNKKWFTELYRITKQGGYVCWNIQETIPNPTDDGRRDFPLSCDIIRIATDLGFIFERQIIWDKKNSTQVMLGSYPYPITPIFFCRKESIFIFRKIGKRIFTTEQKEKCKVESKRWFEIMQDIWQIAPAKATEIGHPATYPIEIPTRFIQVMTVNDCVVLDPFMGSGTTAMASYKLNRKFIGFEISKKYFGLITDRLNAIQAQTSFLW